MNTLESNACSGTRIQIPSALQNELEQEFPSTHSECFLAYTPELVISNYRWPETLLALSKEHWLLLTSREDHTFSHLRMSYADTVLVERTSILLYGQLRIDYAMSGGTRSVTVDYDNVEHTRFNEAAQRIVNSVEAVPFIDQGVPNEITRFEHWPVKFQEAASEYLPVGHHLLRTASWPAVRSGIRRELAPAATLIITEHEFLLLSEDRTWLSYTHSIPQRYGVVATYFPRVRLARTSIVSHQRFSVLSLELHASHGGEAVEIAFPRSSEAAVREAIDVVG